MANYIKGNAVANATSYTLHKKGSTDSAIVDAAIAEQQEGGAISFNLDDLVDAGTLTAGSYFFAVKAHADGYLSSDYSNLSSPEFVVEAATNANVVFDYNFTQNTLDDYALENVFTLPDTSDTSKITYDATKGMNLNGGLPNGLNLINPIDASKPWTLEFTMTIPTPTVLVGNRKAFLGGDNLTPFVFINGNTYDAMGFQISNGAHATKYGNGILVYDQEASYKIVYDGDTTVEIFVNNTSHGTVRVNFADSQFTVILGNVKGKSSAYIWQNVESTPSYLKTFKFSYN